MKFIFFGTPDFAAIILEKLINSGYVPKAVVCNPDKPVGRKKIITPPPVKVLIMKHEIWNIPVLQPEKLDKSFMLQVSSSITDIFIVAAYSNIIPKEILNIPKLGTIGIHPSLLPKYRGATPIQTAILNNDQETGTTLFLMDEKLDHGAIIANSEFRIQNSEWNYEALMKKLANLSADLLIKTLPDFIAGKITPLPQDESLATFTKKFKTEDAFIKPEDLKQAEISGGSL